MRLNKYLATQTGLSRRKADELIAAGLVEIDGEIANFTDPVDQLSVIRLYKDNKWETLGLKKNQKFAKVLFYKPIFCVSTHSDPMRRKTIYDVLPPKYRELNFAGRLDYMSEGLMVLSNDGNYINELTHPSFRKEKTYLVALKYPIRREHIKEMEEGLEIAKTRESYAPIRIERTDMGENIQERLAKYETKSFEFLRLVRDHYVYAFKLQEGQNTQIRKMCKYYGQDVLRLIRVEMGPHKLTQELYNRKFIEL